MKNIIFILLCLSSFYTYALDEKMNAKIIQHNQSAEHLESSGVVRSVNIPSNTISANAPPANAFRGTLYGYEVAIYVNYIFGSEYGLRSVFKVDGDWVYFTEPTFFEAEVSTKADTDKVFSKLVSMINAAAYEILRDDDGGGSVEPSEGVARIQWLLERLTIVDNELIVNP